MPSTDPPPSLLQSDLLSVKHTSDPATLFPSHAFGRGGVGHFICTGHSRVGLHRLPQASSRAASLSLTARGRLGSGRSVGNESMGGSVGNLSGFSLISADPMSVGATRAWEAGTVQHSHNFVAAARTVKPADVPPGSKWAALSYFENNPREVARHMALMNYVEAKHEADKAAERQTEQARHGLWAEQQRETFRRQRLEQAARYARSGMRPRSAYADLGALVAAEAAHGASVASAAATSSDDGNTSGGGQGDASSRDPTRRFYTTAVAAAQARGAFMSAPGSSSAAGSFRLRPSTALPGSAGGSMYDHDRRSTASSNLNFGGGGGAAMPSPPPPQRTVIPLPKKTYVQVYDRMVAEANETPAARVAVMAAAKARAEDERTQAVVAGELMELDTFEARMRSLQRARSRAARAERRHLMGMVPDEDPDYPDDDSDG